MFALKTFQINICTIEIRKLLHNYVGGRRNLLIWWSLDLSLSQIYKGSRTSQFRTLLRYLVEKGKFKPPKGSDHFLSLPISIWWCSSVVFCQHSSRVCRTSACVSISKVCHLSFNLLSTGTFFKWMWSWNVLATSN